jgi:hypothetical protein
VRVNRLIPSAPTAQALEPTSTFELIDKRKDGALVRVMPKCQLVESTASIAAVQVNRRFIGALSLDHHAMSPAAHVHIKLNAGTETGVQRVDQAAAYWNSFERQ